MNLGISQLAFKTQSELIECVDYLKEDNVLNIEIVLPKILDWNLLNMEELQSYVNNLHKLGLTCTSTQSITFNTPITTFSSDVFFSHLRRVCELCKSVGINTIVLGAPKLRDVFNKVYLSYSFKLLDSFLKDNNQVLCIEPNCSLYGGKFFISLDEIVGFLKTNNFTNIKTMIDSHNLLQEGLDLVNEYVKHKEFIHHIHISEIGLGLFKNSSAHLEFSQCLSQHKYEKLIIYEVLSQDNIKPLMQSISQFKHIYNPTNLKHENNLQNK